MSYSQSQLKANLPYGNGSQSRARTLLVKYNNEEDTGWIYPLQWQISKYSLAPLYL